ncbi:MAG: hypothetical protein M5U19_14130 [Microthrixaceae bacterium]|nr:hypothetical protein [Microthrixaceae bacterium]
MLASNLAGIDPEAVAAITHRNAMRAFDFDPFAHRAPELCTVGALRSEATHVDVGPSTPRRRFVPPSTPVTMLDLLTKSDHPLLDDQARAEGVEE